MKLFRASDRKRTSQNQPVLVTSHYLNASPLCKSTKSLPALQSSPKAITTSGSSKDLLRRKSIATLSTAKITKVSTKPHSSSVQNSPLMKALQDNKLSPESLVITTGSNSRSSATTTTASSSQISPISNLPSPAAKLQGSRSLSPLSWLRASVVLSSEASITQPHSISLLNPSAAPPNENTTALLLMMNKKPLEINHNPAINSSLVGGLTSHTAKPSMQLLAPPNHSLLSNTKANNRKLVLDASTTGTCPKAVLGATTSPRLEALIFSDLTSPATLLSQTKARINPLSKEAFANKEKAEEQIIYNSLPKIEGEVVLRSNGSKIIITCPLPEKMKLKVIGGDVYLEADMANGVWLEVADGDLYCDNIGQSCTVIAKEIHCENIGLHSRVVSFGSVLAKNVDHHATLQAIGGDVVAETISSYATIELDPDHTVYAKSISVSSIKNGRQYTFEELSDTLDHIYANTEERDREKTIKKTKF